MAGHAKNRQSTRRTNTKSVVMQDLVALCIERGFPRPMGVSTGTALQEVLDRSVQLWRFADDQLDRLSFETDPDTGEAVGFWEELPGPGGSVQVRPNRWYGLAIEARKDVERIAGLMTQLGIAERHVRVEEARATLVIAAIKEAAIESGLTNDQVRLLGEKLRDKLDGAATDHPLRHEPRVSASRSQIPGTSRTVAGSGPGH